MKYLMTERGYHIIDMTGQKFGGWLILGYSHHTKKNKQYWLCRCDCGFERAQELYSLVMGRTRCCRKCSATLYVADKIAKHRQSGSHLYNTWSAIKQRCYNPAQVRGYKYHGALGVEMCAEWRDDFQAFAAYIGDRPTPHHSLDRYPDPNGNYEPGNVRWATPLEQVQNRRKRNLCTKSAVHQNED